MRVSGNTANSLFTAFRAPRISVTGPEIEVCVAIFARKGARVNRGAWLYAKPLKVYGGDSSAMF